MDGIGAGVVESATIGVVKSNGTGGKIYYAGKAAGNLVVSVAAGAGAVGVGGGTAFAGASGQVYAIPAGMELAGGLGVVAGNSFVQAGTNFSKMSEGGPGKQSVTSNKGNEYDTTPSKDHTVTSKNPGLKGKPNSSVDILDKNGEIATRRWFDSSGKQTRDVDFSNHGNPKSHPEVPHQHGRRP